LPRSVSSGWSRRGCLTIALVVLSGVSACLPLGMLRSRASSDLSCPETDIELTQLGPQIYAAEGCGQRITYVNTSAGWVIESARSGGGEPADAPVKGKPPQVSHPGTGKEPPNAEAKQGSGFVVDGAGSILTANHVVEGASKVTVQCGLRERTTATVVKRDRRHDLALLRSDRPSSDYLPLGSSAAVELGEPVFTVGFPVSDVLGSDPKYTEGTISSLRGIKDSDDLFQISVPIQPGNSGGPLIGKDGKAIGLVTSTASVRAFFQATGTLPQDVNWAVKSDLAQPWVESVAPPKEVALSREAAIQRARAASCLILTGGAEGPAASAPSGAAGFQFRMSPADAEKACSSAKAQWQVDAATSDCSQAPVSVGFEAKVRVEFCEAGLCKISLAAQKEREVSEQVAFFQRLTSTMEKRYGSATVKDDVSDSTCSSVADLMDRCIEHGVATLKREWKWPDKAFVVATLGLVDGKVAVRVEYVDIPAMTPPKKKHRAKKEPPAAPPPGL